MPLPFRDESYAAVVLKMGEEFPSRESHETLKNANAHEGKQRIEKSGSGAALGCDSVQIVAIFLLGAMAMERELCGRKHDGNGGAQVMRDIS